MSHHLAPNFGKQFNSASTTFYVQGKGHEKQSMGLRPVEENIRPERINHKPTWANLMHVQQYATKKNQRLDYLVLDFPMIM